MKNLGKLSILLLFAFVVGGCSQPASDSGGGSDSPSAGAAHPAGWRTLHDSEAQQDLIGCQVCHGRELSGVGKIPGCFGCHGSGPPFTIHPTPFNDPELPWRAPGNHGDAAKRDIGSCQGCHGRPGGPGSNPRFDVPLGHLEAGCESSGCHSPKTAHPTSTEPDSQYWFGPDFTHSNVTSFSSCTLCHGESGAGGAGPSCSACHTLNPMEFPNECVSCHGMQPVGQPEKAIYNLDTGTFLAEYHFAHQAILTNDPEKQDCYLCHGDSAGHPENYWLLHAEAANAALGQCQSCHGADLRGTGIAISCYNCHSGEPPFQLHPRDFRTPEDHGPAAKSDILSCQGCHGEQGGVGSNPRFNKAIGSLEAGCESSGCHSPGTAHPTSALPDGQYWFGPDFTHADLGTPTGCTLCHGPNGSGIDSLGDPSVGPACTRCHTLNPIDEPSRCTSCHGEAPVSTPLTPIYNLDVDTFKSEYHLAHRALLENDPDGQSCALCHGGSAGHPADYRTTHDDDAAANIAQCQLCHGEDLRGIGAAVSCYNCHSGTYPFQLHPRTYRAPEDHGPAAKTSIKSCQGCHGQSGGAGSNPRFNVPIGALEAGCESSGCHSPNTAHPTSSAPDSVFWYGTTVTHFQVGDVETSCTLCHGLNLGGVNGVGPACTQCHELPPATNPTGCASCHGGPLIGEPEVRPAPIPIPNVPAGHLGHDAVSGGRCWSCH